MDNDRLIDTSDLPFERDMLRAAADESIPTDVRRRALASLGLLVIAPPVAAATLGASTTKVASGATSVLSKTLFWQAWIPKVGLLLGLGGIAVGGTLAWERGHVDSTNGSVRAAEVRLRAIPTRATTPKVVELPPNKPDKSVEAAPPGVPAVAKVPSRSQQAAKAMLRAPRPSAPTSTDAKRAASIREEIDLLDRARLELRRGSPDSAITVIREYFARYPAGEFSAEAELVRREAQRTHR